MQEPCQTAIESFWKLTFKGAICMTGQRNVKEQHQLRAKTRQAADWLSGTERKSWRSVSFCRPSLSCVSHQLLWLQSKLIIHLMITNLQQTVKWQQVVVLWRYAAPCLFGGTFKFWLYFSSAADAVQLSVDNSKIHCKNELAVFRSNKLQCFHDSKFSELKISG